MKKGLLLLAIPALLIACAGGNQKKVLVLSHDNPQVDEAAGTITAKAPKGHVEKELLLSVDALKVSTLAGDATINLPAKGYYIANLKDNDTIIGAYVAFTTDASQASTRLTQDVLKKRLDSLQQLIQNKNVSEANRNYFILPNTAVKITDNVDATIIAPYHTISGIPAVADGKAPEVYRFFTANELRATINNLQKLTGAKDTTAKK